MFDSTTAQSYATATQELEANQTALLLSTQGLTNAQIAETLAAKEANTAKNYQAMADAGLLKHKQELTLAQVQQNLQTVLGRDADTSAAMAALGLSGAIEGEEHQIVQITAKKLQEAMASGELTQAQAQELAMRTGITVSMNAQATGVLPRLIASMKATTAAVWLQVKAQAAMMAMNPMTWIMGISAAVGVIKTLFDNHIRSIEETRQATEDAANAYKESASSIEDYAKRYNELQEALACFNRAAELSIANFKVHYNRGKNHLMSGRIEQAVSDFDKAVSLKPEHAKAHELFGDALSRCGKEEAAAIHWAIAETLRDKRNDVNIS